MSVVLGKAEVVRWCLVALLSGEHVLLEDVPGVGKTLVAKALARSVAGDFCRASDAAASVCHDAIQVFGGIGFTWEHDVHFLLKRAKVGGQLLGTAGRHRERVAALSGLG